VDDEVGAYLVHSLQVLTVSPDGITRISAFFDRACVLSFGVPERLDG
jgi:hypothetical protein